MPEEFAGVRDNQGYCKQLNERLTLELCPNRFLWLKYKRKGVSYEGSGLEKLQAQSILGGRVYEEQTHLVKLEYICKSYLVMNLEDWAKFSCQMKAIDDEEP